MKRKDYEKMVRLFADLASLAMKQGSYGESEEYLKKALAAIASARKEDVK